ncbi:MAG: hypothetical protein K2O59_12785 [Lachnospiraceae bacterium]|nr:hypothetical protein [Lachnospiraceae bacterium]
MLRDVTLKEFLDDIGDSTVNVEPIEPYRMMLFLSETKVEFDEYSNLGFVCNDGNEIHFDTSFFLIHITYDENKEQYQLKISDDSGCLLALFVEKKD